MGTPVEATEPRGLRERKKERTRQALEDAALRLFQQKGFEATTIEEIAAAADVSPRTFFRYFAGKDEVLFPEEDARMEDLAAALAARPPGEPPLDKVRAAVIALAADLVDYQERQRGRSRILVETPALRARATERQRVWEELLVSTLLTPQSDELHIRLVVAAVMSALRVCHEHWLANDDGTDLPQLVVEAIDALAGGLQLPSAAGRDQA